MVLSEPLSLAASIGPAIWHRNYPFAPTPPNPVGEGGGKRCDGDAVTAALLFNTCKSATATNVSFSDQWLLILRISR